jgi:hypothetical protein
MHRKFKITVVVRTSVSRAAIKCYDHVPIYSGCLIKNILTFPAQNVQGQVLTKIANRINPDSV